MLDQAVRPPLHPRQPRLICLKTRLIVRELSNGREIRHEIELEKDVDDVMSNRPTRVTRDSHWHHNWTSGRWKESHVLTSTIGDILPARPSDLGPVTVP